MIYRGDKVYPEFRCHCGRFVSDVKAYFNDFTDQLIKVMGTCKRHGRLNVEPYSDFDGHLDFMSQSHVESGGR